MIKGESDIVVANVTLDAFSHRAIYLDCSVVHSTRSADSWPVLPSTLWSYSDTYISQWNQVSFDSSSWERTSRDGFPSLPYTVTTRYYRFTAAVPPALSLFSGYRFGINLRYGVVVYLNGVEQFRINMPDGAISSHTPSIYFEETHRIHSYAAVRETHRRGSLPLSEALRAATSFVVAIEVHYRTGHAVESDDFFAFFHMLPAGGSSSLLSSRERRRASV